MDPITLFNPSQLIEIIRQQREAIEMFNEQMVDYGKERAKLIEVLKAAREVSGFYWDDQIPRYNIRDAIKACEDIQC